MMKSKLKKVALSAILIIVIKLIMSQAQLYEMGIESPHVGLLYVFGLLLGPYGALGAVLGNIIIDLLNGFSPIEELPSAIVSFGVSYLAYKLWYSGIITKRITKPRLDTVEQLILFLSSIVICGLIYSSVHASILGFIFSPEIDEYLFTSYFMNFVNLAFIFGIIGIWISKRKDFVETPNISKRKENKKLYRILFFFLMLITIITSIMLVMDLSQSIIFGQIILLGGLLICYLTKPFKYEIHPNKKNTITEKILRNFLIITLAIAIIGMIISILSYSFITHMEDVNIYLYMMPSLIITDVILILFFVPGIIILQYIERKVIKPISSFSEIESFISENKKIESEGLIDIYSKYINEKNEIGTLARSYTDLIKFNNSYVENIQKIEGEKKRIEAELDIATKIQEANLPTEAIETDEFTVNGYCHPAKEVGGDFFDYYNLDDNHLAIAIGDASGKGVPAAILAMISQVMIKQLLQHDLDPSRALYLLNNQLCEHNPESMFITLWLGIYDKTTKKLIFSNAGHNPPLINENNTFKYLNIDSGIVIGIMEEFQYITEEITLKDELVLYTDGITDANNNDNEMYGENRLLNFFNEFKDEGDPIKPLLNDIEGFTEDAEQFDDMTLLYLKIK